MIFISSLKRNWSIILEIQFNVNSVDNKPKFSCILHQSVTLWRFLNIIIFQLWAVHVSCVSFTSNKVWLSNVHQNNTQACNTTRKKLFVSWHNQLAAEAVDIKSKADNFFCNLCKIIKTFYVSKKLYDIYSLIKPYFFHVTCGDCKKGLVYTLR